MNWKLNIYSPLGSGGRRIQPDKRVNIIREEKNLFIITVVQAFTDNKQSTSSSLYTEKKNHAVNVAL